MLSKRLNALNPQALISLSGYPPAGFEPGIEPDEATLKQLMQSTRFPERVLQLRPHSSDFWWRAARSNFETGGPVKETLKLLDRSRHLAPFNLSVRREELSLGFALWHDLPEPRRETIYSSVRYLIPRYPDLVIQSAVANDWSENLRPMLTQEKHLKKLDLSLAAMAEQSTIQ